MHTKAHILPFAVWIIVMVLFDEPKAWMYAMRTFMTVVVLLWCRPWRWYQSLDLKHVPASIGVGVLVCVIWVLPEVAWHLTQKLQVFYLTWAVLPLGNMPAESVSSAYDPDACGWSLTLIRLLGSAFVIAIAEEFFWRGFLYRWLIKQDFMEVDLGQFQYVAYFVVSVLFGLEHNRWLVGILSGFAYTTLLIKTRDIWAVCLAHIVTNFVLGIYVLMTDSYSFW